MCYGPVLLGCLVSVFDGARTTPQAGGAILIPPMQYYKRWTGDYARDTGDLSLAEHGAYSLLLDHYYSTGVPLPDDVTRLCRLVRAVDPSEVAAVHRVLTDFFPVAPDGLRHNKRADEEIAKSLEFNEKQRGKAQKRWAEPSHSNASGNATAMPQHMPRHKSGIDLAYALAMPTIADTHSHSHSLKANPGADTDTNVKRVSARRVLPAERLFEHPDHQAAYESHLAAAKSPMSVTATIHAISGGMHGTAYALPVIGQALVEILAANGTFSPSGLRAFCRKLVEAPAPNGKPLDKISEGRATLARSLATLTAQSNG